MDFSQLKQKYPFLESILRFYNKLEESVVGDDQYQIVLNLCDKPNTFNTMLTPDKKNTCKKILRNLFICSSVDTGEIMNSCGNLYVWLYFELEKSSISNEIIKKVFELPTSKENEGPKYYACPYVTFYGEIDNPEKLMKLSLFNDNSDTIGSMLKDNIDSNVCYLKKYVYECVGIYREMMKTYRFPVNCGTSPYTHACGIINEFHRFYGQHILNKQGIDHQFPELLPDTPLNYTDDCPVEETEPASSSDETQQDTPTRGVVPTALTAMVGIPPFLALIYKFTPVGQLLRSRYYKGIANNIGENELFYPTTENMNNISDQTRYNVLYGPVTN